MLHWAQHLLGGSQKIKMNKKILIFLIILNFGCSGSSQYDGLWFVDSERSTQSCQAALMVKASEEIEEDFFEGLMAGLGSMGCSSFINSVFSMIEIKNKTAYFSSNELEGTCDVDDTAKEFVCPGGSMKFRKSENILVITYQGSEQLPSFQIFFRKEP